MKILFYDTQNYDRESFDRTKEQFPEIEVEYLKTGLAARTASPVSYTHLTLPTN